MVKKIVGCDSLATLMVLDKSLELTPEPIRCQPNLNLICSFDEYVDFVKKYLNQVNILATPTLKLRALIELYSSQNSPTVTAELFSAFLRDTSLAICKELYFAEHLGKGATKITHEVSSTIILSDKDINEYYDLVAPHILPELCGLLSDRGFRLLSVKGVNEPMWRYAVVAFYLSGTGKFLWSYKI